VTRVAAPCETKMLNALTREMAVTIVTRLQGGRTKNRVQCLAGEEVFQRVQNSSEAHPASYSPSIMDFFIGVKRSGREADHSLLLNV